MIASVISPEVREWIVQDYLSGMSLWQVSQKYHWLRKHDLRQVLEGHIRPKTVQRTNDPSEEEVVQRREAIKASWTPEQARARWVGRYASRPEYLGSSLSRALRDMGGDE